MAKKRTQGKQRFKGLQANAFQHAQDREALRKLDRLPGMQPLLRRVSAETLEKMFRMLNLADRIRVTRTQFPKIHEMFRESCEILDIKEIPEIYLTTSPIQNAFSFGIRNYTVILF